MVAGAGQEICPSQASPEKSDCMALHLNRIDLS